MVHHHRFLLVTFPAQGHINPTLQFAKTLTRMGLHDVTLFTTVHMLRRMNKSTTVSGLSFATFSDGFDDGFHSSGTSIELYLSELRRLGSKALANLITSGDHRPFTCVVHSMLLPWAEEVAREFHVPTALLWPQPATVFDIYYYYFKDYDYIKNRVNRENREDPSCLIQLPGLPPFETQDLPSFLTSSEENDVYSFALPSFKEQFRVIQQEPKYTILVNTFEELETEALRSVVDSNINMVSIGPLIPSAAFLNGVDPSDTSFGGDLFEAKSNEYMEWLESKTESSVVYVSFGSISVLSKRQMEEIAGALLECGYPFLWVIREKDQKKGEQEEREEEVLSEEYREELSKKGKIVGWCKQVEVLSHGSVGCFVTHCGWNSSLESLTCGVPVVAVPQWTDQNTNAKLLEDVWKTGVRAKKTSVEEGVVVERDEIRRCLDVVMGSGDLRNNAKKWKDLASKAVNQGGSSHVNLTTFLRNLPSPN